MNKQHSLRVWATYNHFHALWFMKRFFVFIEY